MGGFLRGRLIDFRLASALYLVLGAVLALWPGTVGILLCRVLGGVLLLCGVVLAGGCLLRDRGLNGLRLELVFGVIAGGIGLFFLLRPWSVLSLLPTLLGLYVVVDSIAALVRSARLYRLEYRRWWVSMLLAALGVLMGGALMLRPFGAVRMLIRFMGLVFLYLGVSDLWSLYKLEPLTQEARRNSPMDEDPWG